MVTAPVSYHGDDLVACVTETRSEDAASVVEAFFYAKTSSLLDDEHLADCIDRVLARGYVWNEKGRWKVCPDFRWHRQFPDEPKPRPVEAWSETPTAFATFEDAWDLAHDIVDVLLATPGWMRAVARDCGINDLGGMADALSAAAQVEAAR